MKATILAEFKKPLVIDDIEPSNPSYGQVLVKIIRNDLYKKSDTAFPNWAPESAESHRAKFMERLAKKARAFQ